MKGLNTLRFNQATLIDALQEYINKRITTDAGKQTVLSVTYESPSYGSGVGEFVVKIEEKTNVS
jgi:hypothetical protein